MSDTEFISLAHADATLCGIHHAVKDPQAVVVVVVGGPQYRVGSHRQYVALARHLQANRIACIRMDYSGMGDSTGTFPGFENLAEQNAAFVTLARQMYPDTSKLAMYGICDAASSIALSLPQMQAVTHAILVNPWVQESGEEDSKPKAYYKDRLLAWSFWRKFFTGEVEIVAAVRESIASLVRRDARSPTSFVQVMAENLDNWAGDMRLQLSSDDLVAQEFERKIGASIKAFADKLQRIEGDHTFSTKAALTSAMEDCVNFIATDQQTKRC